MRSKIELKIYTVFFLVLLLWWAAPVLADAQCAMCNATASTATEGKKESALALNTGILFLMTIPYILLSGLVLIWWKFSMDRKREQAE